MGKYIIEVGLVYGTEHLCNSCFLLEHVNCTEYRCFATKEHLEINENKIVRKESCPLIKVEKWQSEEQ